MFYNLFLFVRICLKIDKIKEKKTIRSFKKDKNFFIKIIWKNNNTLP